MHTPYKYRAKKAAELNGAMKDAQNADNFEPPRDAFTKVSDPQFNSNEAAFNRFRERLHLRTEKWFEQRDAGSSSPKGARQVPTKVHCRNTDITTVLTDFLWLLL
jgi:hypothetical protein